MSSEVTNYDLKTIKTVRFHYCNYVFETSSTTKI